MTDVYVITRVPETFRNRIKVHAQSRGHMSQSEFFREALREKMEREAPNIVAPQPEDSIGENSEALKLPLGFSQATRNATIKSTRGPDQQE